MFPQVFVYVVNTVVAVAALAVAGLFGAGFAALMMDGFSLFKCEETPEAV